MAVALASLPAAAQTAPRPLRILVPFSAGGASDTYTRIAALKITEQTGRSIVVENRTGAGGRIAWEAAAKAAPDGATAALIDATYPMLPGLYEKLPWDVANDLVPAAMICQTPFVITVGAGSKLESLAALIAEARAHPGKLNFGSAGVGSVNHVVSELFRVNARVAPDAHSLQGHERCERRPAIGADRPHHRRLADCARADQGRQGEGLAVSTAQRSAALPGGAHGGGAGRRTTSSATGSGSRFRGARRAMRSTPCATKWCARSRLRT